MPRPICLLLALLSLAFTTTSLAQIPDLHVSLEAPATMEPGRTYLLRGTVSNRGNGTANDVIFRFAAQPYRECHPGFSIAKLGPGESRTLDCSVTLPATDLPSYTLRTWLGAITQGGQLDTNFLDNSLDREIPILSPPDLYVISFPGAGMPGLPYRVEIHYGNRAQTAATGTTITIDSPTRILSVPESCTVTGTRAVCNVGTVAPLGAGDSTLVLVIEAPDLSAHRFDIPIVIDANEADAGPASNAIVAQGSTFPTFFVTNTADAGSGSLRAAIEAANAAGEPSVSIIAFRIPPAAQAWQTIRVESPLPVLTARSIRIDGTTQSDYFGDTNPAGPEIELTGTALTHGHGIDISTACGVSISRLAINGFPGNGINISPSTGCALGFPRIVEGSYIGTDPTGTRAIPNARGISIGHGEWRIQNNVISGNRNSGIFIVQGKQVVRNNIIGLNATVTDGLGNQASGVYIGPRASGTDVEYNFIGFNHHFGVALDRATTWVSMRGNSFQANQQTAIDWGLDNLASAGPVPVPVITSVRVENGQTIIEGTHEADSTFPPHINIFANDVPDPSGYGEGQYFLAEFQTRERGKFSYTHPADLRGKWITATATQVYYVGFLTSPPVRSQTESQGFMITTSEFSRAVEVR